MEERIINFHIPEEMDGLSVRQVLVQHFHFAGSLISRLKQKPDGYCINGVKVYTNAIVHYGDLLSINITDSNPHNPAEPRYMPLDIRFEDEDLVIINKEPGVAVHGSDRIDSPTIANAFAYHYGSHFSFHPVHRLDKGTSGLLVLAKNTYIQDRLRRLMHTDMFRREYLAITEQIVLPANGIIDQPISKEPVTGIRRIIDPSGLPSVTQYSTIKTSNEHSLISAIPITGRTHQIRLHFSSIGFPLIGDTVYGTKSDFIDRPALHSQSLHIVHPIKNTDIALQQDMPEDMLSLL